MELEYILELVGTFFFAISGALAVKDNEHDWFGATFTGFVTAIGGGSLRDILLNSYPLTWIEDINFVYAIILGVVSTKISFKFLLKLRRTLLLFDTLGISLFAIGGTEKALSLGAKPVIAVIMGMFSAVMGGVIRDTLTNNTPVIFRREIYASACVLGASNYLLLNQLGVPRNINLILSIVVIVALRLVAIKYNLKLPEFFENPGKKSSGKES